MEQNAPIIAKKIWNLMRVAFYMLRKGICKTKIIMDLNMMMKRGKIASKALHNIMFHLNHHQNNHQYHSGANHMVAGDDFSMHMQQYSTNPQGEYEFSCSNTPLYKQYFTNNKKKNHNKSSYYMPSPLEDINNIDMYDMMGMSSNEFEASSPALPGLGFERSPAAVRQLRITDSPFPVKNNDADNDEKHVDVAAEEFIKKFYSQLKQQKFN